MRRLLLPAVLLVALLALAATSLAGGPGERIGVAQAAGDYAAATASASANRPLAIYVKVVASPRQRVSGNWSVTCGKGAGAGSKSGRFSGRSTLVRRLRLPMRRPDFCGVGALGQLDGSGRIRVEIFKR